MKLTIMLIFFSIIGCSTAPTIEEIPPLPEVENSIVMQTDPCKIDVVIKFVGHEDVLVVTVPPEMVCPDKDSGHWI